MTILFFQFIYIVWSETHTWRAPRDEQINDYIKIKCFKLVHLEIENKAIIQINVIISNKD